MQQTSPKLADGGGGGGIGNFINMGGGGGGDDGDDDDFFGGGGEEGDGDGEGWFRSATAELFDMGAIQAVLSEWGYTVSSLPMFFRASAELFFTGAFSSANMVRFLCRDNRPTLARWLYEHLPYSVSRGLVGRLIADPGLAQKVALDMALTAGTNVYWEARQRGEQFWRELDLVAINTASAAAAAGAMVYMLAPARVGTAARAPWQEMLASLPNNVFEAGSKTRSFTLGSRAMGFLSKAAELSAVGAVTGAAMSGLGSAAVQLRRRADPTFQPSVPVPEMSRAVAGMGAFMGLSANLRYNVLAGLDRYMFERAKVLGYYVASTALARGASAYVGQPSRLWSLGLPMTLPPEIPGYVYMGRGKVSGGAGWCCRAPMQCGRHASPRLSAIQTSPPCFPSPAVPAAAAAGGPCTHGGQGQGVGGGRQEGASSEAWGRGQGQGRSQPAGGLPGVGTTGGAVGGRVRGRGGVRVTHPTCPSGACASACVWPA